MGAVHYEDFTAQELAMILANRKSPKPLWKRIVHQDGWNKEDLKNSKEISDEFEAWLIILPVGIKAMIITTIMNIIMDQQAWLSKNAIQIKNNLKTIEQIDIEEEKRTSLLETYDELYTTLNPLENKTIPEVDDLFRYLMYSQEQKQEKRRHAKWKRDTFNLDTTRLKNLRGLRDQRNAQLKTWMEVIMLYMNAAGGMNGVVNTMTLVAPEDTSENAEAYEEYSNLGESDNFMTNANPDQSAIGEDEMGISEITDPESLTDVGTAAGFATGGPAGALIGEKTAGLLSGDPSSLSSLAGGDAMGALGAGDVLGGSDLLGGGMGDMVSGGGLGSMLGGEGGGLGGMMDMAKDAATTLTSKDTLSAVGSIASAVGSCVPGPWGAALCAGGSLMQGGSLSDAAGAGLSGMMGGNSPMGSLAGSMMGGAGGGMMSGLMSGGSGGLMAGVAGSMLSGSGYGGLASSVLGGSKAGGISSMIGNNIMGSGGSGILGGVGANVMGDLAENTVGNLSNKFIGSSSSNIMGNLAGSVTSNIMKGKGSTGIVNSLVNASGSLSNSNDLTTGLAGNLAKGVLTNAGSGGIAKALSKTVSKGLTGNLGKAYSTIGSISSPGAIVSNLTSNDSSANIVGLHSMGDLLGKSSGFVQGNLKTAAITGSSLLKGESVSSDAMSQMKFVASTINRNKYSTGKVSGDGGFAGLGNGVTAGKLGTAIGKFLGGANGAKVGKVVAESLTPEEVGSAVFNNYGSKADLLLKPSTKEKMYSELKRNNLLRNGVSSSSETREIPEKYPADLVSEYLKTKTNSASGISTMGSINDLFTGMS